MKTRSRQLIAALLAATAVGAQAAVNINVNNNSDGTNKTWTVTDLNNAPPSVSGDNAPDISGFLGAAGTLAADAEIIFTFTAAKNWSATEAQTAIGADTFGSYIEGLDPCLIDAAVQAFGIDSSPGDAQPNRINRQGEVLLIELDTTNVTETITLEGFGFELMGITDYADILIYHADPNSVTEIQWDSRIDQMPAGPWEIAKGDIMVVAVGASMGTAAADNFRWNDITFDIPSTAVGVVPPIGFGAAASNSLVQLDWVAESSAEFDYYNVYRSLTTNEVDFTLVSSPTNSSYTDSDVTNNVTYYYMATTVDTNSTETAFSEMISATPVVTVPTGFTAEAGDEKVILTWDGIATNDLKFGTFTVYRSYNNTNFTDVVASNITALTVTDTNVVNELLYYYAVSLVDTDGDESELSEVKGAVPSKALVIVNMVNNQQADLRVDLPDGTNAWPDVDSAVRVVLGQARFGIYAFATSEHEMARTVLGFPLKQTDLGNQSVADIEYVKLRFWMHSNNLMTNGPHSSVEVYHSRTRPNDVSVTTADWKNTANDEWALIGTVQGLTNNAPDGWYEIDVTTNVLNDLNLDPLDLGAVESSFGSSFQLRANDDLSFTTNMYIINTTYTTNDTVITTNMVTQSTGAKLNDNLAEGNGGTGSPLGAEFVPQIKIKFTDNRSGYLQWTDNFLPTVIGTGDVDYDLDGLSNIEEYGLDGDPTDINDQGTLPEFTGTGSGFVYVHPKRSDDTNVVYTVETTTNLKYIPFAATGYTVGGTDVTGNTLDFVTNNVTTVEDQKFIRLQIDYN